jgi:hypothetical protein
VRAAAAGTNPNSRLIDYVVDCTYPNSSFCCRRRNVLSPSHWN